MHTYENIRKHPDYSQMIAREANRSNTIWPSNECSDEFRRMFGRPWKGGEQVVIELDIRRVRR